LGKKPVLPFLTLKGVLSVYTVESTIAALEKYDIDPQTLAEWERELNLTIPMDETGHKRYSPHHINLFKNIRKHLALGRSLSQIRDMVTLPPSDQAKPTGKPGVYVTQPSPSRTQAQANPMPQVVTSPVVVASQPGLAGQATMHSANHVANGAGCNSRYFSQQWLRQAE
jgi:DNA-binding transcriptional MerR regulator